MSRIFYLTLTWFALLAVASRAVAQGPISEKSAVVVALFPEAAVDDGLVYLDQIAKLSGGTPELRRRIAKLDIAELKLFAERTTVPANQVKFRLLLAGIESKQFRLTGAKQTIVTEIDEPITLRKVLASAEWALRQKYPGETTKVTITPAKGVILPLIDVRANDRVQFEGKVNSAAPKAGKARVDVAIIVNGKTREVVPVHLDITLGDAFAKAGSRDFGILPSGSTVPASDPLEVIIKNRDLVKIVAQIGAARIEARGEAMEDGKRGQAIRVRNTESNRVVSGRVEESGTVIVEY